MSEGRDLSTNPYSAEELRVAQFFFDKGVGGGDDPIGALMASHEYLVWQRHLSAELIATTLAESRALLQEMQELRRHLEALK